MSNIINLPTPRNLSAEIDEIFGSIIYRDDLMEMIDSILDEHMAPLKKKAKAQGDISEQDVIEATAILGFVDRMHTELKKYRA